MLDLIRVFIFNINVIGIYCTECTKYREVKRRKSAWNLNSQEYTCWYFHIFPSSSFSREPISSPHLPSPYHLVMPFVLPIFHDAYVTSPCPVLFLGCLLFCWQPPKLWCFQTVYLQPSYFLISHSFLWVLSPTPFRSYYVVITPQICNFWALDAWPPRCASGATN